MIFARSGSIGLGNRWIDREQPESAISERVRMVFIMLIP